MDNIPNENAILPDELKEMFGEAVPLEIYNLMYNAHPGTTVGKLRSEIRKTAQEMFLKTHLLEGDIKTATSIFRSVGWELVAIDFDNEGKSSSNEEHVQDAIRNVLITVVKQRLLGEKTGMEKLLEIVKPSLQLHSKQNVLFHIENTILNYKSLLFNFNNHFR